jgi:uroporphyrinogen decarboxylase
MTILYLKEKVKAGVDAVQVLILGRNVVSVDYQEFSWKYINQIIEALADHAPVIVLKRMLVCPK